MGQRLGKYINSRRKAAGLSLREVAADTGVSPMAIRHAEVGRNNMTPALLYRTCRALKCSYLKAVMAMLADIRVEYLSFAKKENG